MAWPIAHLLRCPAVTNGYSLEELVALSGAHELGASSAGGRVGINGGSLHSPSAHQLWPWEVRLPVARLPAKPVAMDMFHLPFCAFSAGFRQDRTTPMTANPNSFTNEYFTAVINGNRNLFNSDRVLWGNHARSNAAVQSFANNKPAFFTAFAKASRLGCGAS